MMLRRIALVAAMFAGTAMAQDDLALSAQDIRSGAADAKLAQLGREAAASGKEVVVNAPKEWHAQVAAKIRAGGKTDVKLNDSFFESVVVRLADKPAAKPVEAPKAVEPPKPAVASAPVTKPVAPPLPPKAVEAPPVRAEPVPPPAPPVAAAPAPVETPVVEAAPPPPPAAKPVAPTPPPAAKPTQAKAPAPVAVVDESAVARKRMEQSLYEGKPAEGELTALQLEKGDLLYIDGPVIGVVRRGRLSPRLFWLDGDINLKRAELKTLAANRYEVVDNITSNDDISLRGRAEEGPQLVKASIPAEDAAERIAMEKAYSEGRSIVRSLRPDQLKAGDLLYAGKVSAVAVRRDGTNLVRYWLEGSLDLNQPGLQKDGSNKYRVLSDTVK